MPVALHSCNHKPAIAFVQLETTIVPTYFTLDLPSILLTTIHHVLKLPQLPIPAKQNATAADSIFLSLISTWTTLATTTLLLPITYK
jgi:hypothetical protein